MKTVDRLAINISRNGDNNYLTHQSYKKYIQGKKHDVFSDEKRFNLDWPRWYLYGRNAVLLEQSPSRETFFQNANLEAEK